MGRRLRQATWRVLAWVSGAALALFTRLVMATLRVDGPPLPEGAVVLACWHRHLPLTIPFAGQRRVWTMMSPAAYMAPIAAWARLMGMRLVRGTSGAGGRQALTLLAQKIADGGAVLLAVDGPRGPAFVAKPGCAELAETAGVAVFAFGFRARRVLELPTWDRQSWPLPFSRVEIVLTRVERTGAASLLDDVQQALGALAPGEPSRESVTLESDAPKR